MANGNSESQSTRRRPTNVQAAKQTTLGKLGPAISRSALKWRVNEADVGSCALATSRSGITRKYNDTLNRASPSTSRTKSHGIAPSAKRPLRRVSGYGRTHYVEAASKPHSMIPSSTFVLSCPIANSNNATTRPSTPEPVQTDTRPSTPDPAQNTATRPSTPEQENSSARGLLPATASVSPNISTITSTPEPPIHTTGGFPTDVHGVELSSISRRNLRGVNSICMTSMADVGSFVSMNESHHPPVASIFATTSFQPAEPLSVTQTPVALRADATVEMDIYDPPNQGPPPGSSLPSPPQCYSSNPIHSEPMHSKPLAPAGSACYDMRFETPPPIINFANTNPTTLPINVYEEMGFSGVSSMNVIPAQVPMVPQFNFSPPFLACTPQQTAERLPAPPCQPHSIESPYWPFNQPTSLFPNSASVCQPQALFPNFASGCQPHVHITTGIQGCEPQLTFAPEHETQNMAAAYCYSSSSIAEPASAPITEPISTPIIEPSATLTISDQSGWEPLPPPPTATDARVHPNLYETASTRRCARIAAELAIFSSSDQTRAHHPLPKRRPTTMVFRAPHADISTRPATQSHVKSRSSQCTSPVDKTDVKKRPRVYEPDSSDEELHRHKRPRVLHTSATAYHTFTRLSTSASRPERRKCRPEPKKAWSTVVERMVAKMPWVWW